MFFEDKPLTCKDCSEPFLFTAGEQSFYKEKGLVNVPGRCHDCREKRKTAAMETQPAETVAAGAIPVTSVREICKVNCAECDRETTVPFRPRLGKPVLCGECFYKQRQAQATAALQAEVAPPEGIAEALV